MEAGNRRIKQSRGGSCNGDCTRQAGGGKERAEQRSKGRNVQRCAGGKTANQKAGGREQDIETGRSGLTDRWRQEEKGAKKGGSEGASS